MDDDLQTVEVVRDSINWSIFGIDEVEIAYNVTGAKKLFEAKTPDIVICDIEMPKGSGIELLKWVRSNNFKSEFIFLTCHESFEFAKDAIKLNAIDYITKPFNIDKTEMSIAKAIEKIQKENHLNEYSQYGQYWMQNKKLIVESFWRELLFYSIPAKASTIFDEVSKRKLSLDVNGLYYLVLVSVEKPQNEDVNLDDQSIEYQIKKISSDVVLGGAYSDNTIYYVTDRKHYAVIIVQNCQSIEQLKKNCLDMIEIYRRKLNYTVTCYISNKCSLYELAKERQALEEIDLNNIIFKSRVFLQGDEFIFNTNGQYIIEANLLSTLFEKGDKLQIVNNFKRELEMLTGDNKLDAATMYSINQDFMQVVYTYLHKREIQAHKLFSDKASQKLNSNANNSVFDMLKWINVVTTKTIDYAKEVEKSQTIVDKAKQYIQEHFKENITRNEVSASVFLTPDYISKMFKSEIGISIKEYINNYRIEKAKELLRVSDFSISMIAAEVGFDNFSYFSTIFKKLTGTSPYSYRKGTD